MFEGGNELLFNKSSRQCKNSHNGIVIHTQRHDNNRFHVTLKLYNYTATVKQMKVYKVRSSYIWIFLNE